MDFYSISDIGLKRDKNQDAYCTVKNKNGDFLVLVCDGIGGEKAGEVASEETIKFINDSFKNANIFNNIDDAIEYLKDTISKCNLFVYNLAKKYKEYSGMGTTLTGLLFTKFGILSINIGDSRVYGFIDKKIFKLTTDHTLINEMLAKGEITLEEAENHPKRHYIVKAIGVWAAIEADIHIVKDMDYYLICSDGLHGYVSEEKINEIMCDKFKSAKDKANILLKEALLAGGYDNITAVVLDING